MRTAFAALALSLVAASCGAADTDAPIVPALPDSGGMQPPEAPPPPKLPTGDDLNDKNYNLHPISDLQLTGTESPADIATLLQERFGLGDPVEGNYSEITEIEEDGAYVRITFSMDGFTDDSVRGEQHLVLVNQTAAVSAGVIGYGTRFKCWRGKTPNTWTIKPCP